MKKIWISCALVGLSLAGIYAQNSMSATHPKGSGETKMEYRHPGYCSSDELSVEFCTTLGAGSDHVECDCPAK
jgi:hypothetical protein